jgi:cytochrome c biogenesis protein CcdA
LFGLVSTLIIVLLGFSVLGNKYYRVVNSLPLFAYFITIILGLLFLNIVQIKIDTSLFNNIILNKFSNIIKNFIFGCFLAVNTAPCSTPILLTLVFVLSFSSNYLLIVFYISIYLLGYILPIILIINFMFRSQYISGLSIMFSISTSWGGVIVLSWGLLKLLESLFL